MQNLIRHINQFAEINDDALNAFTSKIISFKVRKNELLLKADNVCNYLYFLQSGSLISFYYKSGKKITIGFTFPNDFVTSLYSFVSRKPSYENIEAMEDSSILAISYQDLQDLFNTHPILEKVYRVILEHYYIKMEEKIIFDKFKTAKERYLNLMENRPEIIQKAGVGEIASFLSISIETLSRIRSKN